MFERVALFKLVDPGYREEVAAAARALASVPGVRGVRIGTPADQDSAVWDLLVAVTFDRLEDLRLFLNHPVHREFQDRAVGPRVQVQKGWSFRLD
jgi:hypothetical protein